MRVAGRGLLAGLVQTCAGDAGAGCAAGAAR